MDVHYVSLENEETRFSADFIRPDTLRRRLDHLAPSYRIVPLDWAVVAYLGLFQIGLAYVAMTRGMQRTPAFEASLLLLLEPVLNSVWAWLVHSEQPGPASLLGCSLILVASLATTFRARG